MTNPGLISPLFALGSFADQWRQMSSTRHQLIIGLVILALITFAAAIWALFIQAPSENRRARGQVRREGEPHRKRRKWKRRRREHRPRNPTLAETGGLPPPRENPPVGPIP